MAKNECKCDCSCIHEEKMMLAKSALEKFRIFSELENFFKTFADNTRLKIMCVLDEVGSMCVCDIAVALNMTKSAISHQLNYLKKANLIKSSKKGKEVFYSLADEHVKDIFEMGVEHLQEIE